MSIIGIGSDIVSLARIKRIWERYQEAFPRRILNKAELEHFSKARCKVAFLAKRYAAKEATAKALGTGFRPGGVLLTDIAVQNDSLGRPFLELSGGAHAEWQKRNVVTSHLTLSDEKEFALAFVVLVGE